MSQTHTMLTIIQQEAMENMVEMEVEAELCIVCLTHAATR